MSSGTRPPIEVDATSRTHSIAKEWDSDMHSQPPTQGEPFYTSENGDIWLLVDTGSTPIVTHVPNTSSGGTTENIDLESFRDREPGSPQNEALEEILRSRSN